MKTFTVQVAGDDLTTLQVLQAIYDNTDLSYDEIKVTEHV